MFVTSQCCTKFKDGTAVVVNDPLSCYVRLRYNRGHFRVHLLLSGCFGPWLTLKLSLHPSSCVSLSVSVDIHMNLVRNFKSVAVGATLKTPYEGLIVWGKSRKETSVCAVIGTR